MEIENVVFGKHDGRYTCRSKAALQGDTFPFSNSVTMSGKYKVPRSRSNLHHVVTCLDCLVYSINIQVKYVHTVLICDCL